MNEISELTYRGIISLAVSLYNNGETMNCDELLEWINKKHPQTPPYGGVRGVLQAAHSRAKTDAEREALENVFVNKKGDFLVKD